VRRTQQTATSAIRWGSAYGSSRRGRYSRVHRPIPPNQPSSRIAGRRFTLHDYALRRPALPSCACRRCLVVVRARRVRPPPVCGVVRAVAPVARRQVNHTRRSRRCRRCWVRGSGQRGSIPRLRLSLVDALRRRGMSLPAARYRTRSGGRRCAGTGVDGGDAARHLACGLATSSCIPARVINDWIPDDPITVAAKALLPEWVRWHREQAGLPEHLVDRGVAVATGGVRAASDCAGLRV